MTAAACAAPSCQTPIPDTEFLCAQHWSMVPASLRDALQRPGTPPDRDSPYASAALAEIDHKERRQKARARATTPTKPVQLTLF